MELTERPLKSPSANQNAPPSPAIQNSPSIDGHSNRTLTAVKPGLDTSSLYSEDPRSSLPEKPTVFGDGGGIPSAMESEMFDNDGEGLLLKQRQGGKRGAWNKTKSGMRKIWSTRQLEDTGHNSDLYVKTTFRELIMHIIFLIIICILTFGMANQNFYYYSRVLKALFVEPMTTCSPSAGCKTSLLHVKSMEGFWLYTNNQLMEALFWDQWYNKAELSPDDFGLVYYENRLIGLPRLRQLRVGNKSCAVPSLFGRQIKQCFSAYSSSAESTASFSFANTSAWQYNIPDQGSGMDYIGWISLYGRGGFFQDLSRSKANALSILSSLESGRWIDRGTRAIFIDFSMYNANVNLFAIVKLIFEFPATGGILPDYNIRIQKYIRYHNTFDYFILACEGIFCAFVVYFVVEEVLEIWKHRCRYFCSFFNVLDVALILLAFFCIGFNVYSQTVVSAKLKQLTAVQNQYVNFEFICWAAGRYNDALAIMVFLAWIKIFKYISLNRTMVQLSATLGRCSKDIGAFAIMFFIFFFAYAQLGYLIFGTQMRQFSSFGDAVFSLLRLILGDFEFAAMQKANRVLGPLFFVTFVFLVFFVLLNMFLAIINDTYAEVKQELLYQQGETRMSNYFHKVYSRMLRKLNLKKERLVDIRDAMNDADTSHEKLVDFEEWRRQMKERGYSEQEITSMFAKYDLDGDRVLDEFEMQKIQDPNAVPSIPSYIDREPKTVIGHHHLSTTSSGYDVFDYETRGDAVSQAVSYHSDVSTSEGFNMLWRRMNRTEKIVGSIIGKLDMVLANIETLEQIKIRQRKSSSHAAAGGTMEEGKDLQTAKL